MALKRIQDLDAAATLDGTEIVELEQSGGSVQCTAQDIANLAVGTGGDVTGPASSTDGNLAVFDGTTGKLLKDGGTPGGMALVDDAPSDGSTYGRKDGAWEVVAGGGGGGAVDSVNGQTGTVTLTEGDIVAGINAQTGTTYTAVLTDEVITMDNVAANTLTIPPNSSVEFPIGCSLEVWQKGAGQTTIVADTGVTILYNAANTLKLKGQNSGCSLRKVATDTWRLIGDMEQV